MEIDSTPLDVLVLLDDGVPGRVELTGLIDVATRTVPAAVIGPTAKSVDASVLLARALTPEPMRPGWPASLAMAHSALPYDRLLGIDERLRHAAARPVIVPDTIVIDHGSVFVSGNFRASCRHLGISIQPAHLATGSDKPHIEKMFSSLGTLFCQFAAGYLGRSADRRGRRVEEQPLWSLLQMQDLLDEWLISVWQNREHDGLREPLHPQRAFSPNQKYAALIETAGYVPVPLSAGDYIELLPAVWRAVNAYGIKISHRTYDAEELEPDPAAEIRGHRTEGPVGGPSRSLRRVTGVRPRAGRLDRLPVEVPGEGPGTVRGTGLGRRPGQLAEQGQPASTELERALAVDDLLRRAYHGPPDEAAEPQAPAQDASRQHGTGPAGRRPHACRHGSPRKDRGDRRCGSCCGQGRSADTRAGHRRTARQGDSAGHLRPLRGGEETMVKRRLARAPTISAQAPVHLDGWREFTTLPRGRSVFWQKPSDAALGSGARAAHDEERLDYHTRLGVVGTSVLRQVVTDRPAADAAEPARHQRPPRPDPVRRGRDRQDHRDHPARQDARGDRPGTPPGPGTDSRHLRDRAAGGDAADAGHGIRPVPRAPGPGPRQHDRHHRGRLRRRDRHVASHGPGR